MHDSGRDDCLATCYARVPPCIRLNRIEYDARKQPRPGRPILFLFLRLSDAAGGGRVARKLKSAKSPKKAASDLAAFFMSASLATYPRKEHHRVTQYR